jgi:plastocyanin
MTRAAAVLLSLVVALGLSGCGDKNPTTDGMSSSAPAGPDSQPSSAEPTAKPVLTDGPGVATLTFSGGEGKLGEGSFDQDEVKVKVGQVVEFRAGDGGTYAVKVGGLDGVTITGGLKEYYRFDAPGTYSVQEDLSGATASILVE